MTWLDDLQRRLAIAGARSLGQQFAGQLGRTIRGESDDVWGTATTEPEGAAGEAPECAWCPVCRAIRMARGSNPDLAGRVGETADALMSAAHEVVAAVDAAFAKMPRQQAPPSPDRPDAGTAEPQEQAASQERAAEAEPAEPQAPQEGAASQKRAASQERAASQKRAASQERAAPPGPAASASEEPSGTVSSPNGQRA